MTTRQAYKKQAMVIELGAFNLADGRKWPEQTLNNIASECGRIADAMILEDKEHEEKMVAGV